MSDSRGNGTKSGQGPNTVVLAVVGGIVAVVAMFAVIFVTGGDDDADVTTDSGSAPDGEPVREPVGDEFGTVAVDGTPLPRLDGASDPAVGAPAPTFRSDGPYGTTIVDTGDGTPKALFFLAHWCPHCQAELPRLVELHDDGAFDGIDAVAVLIATDSSSPNYPPSSWLDEESWEGPRAYDSEDGSAAIAYGVTGLPFMVFVDGDGDVVARMAGEQSPETIEAVLDDIRE